MDGLSTAAAVLQIADLTGRLITSLSRFVEQTRTIVDSIKEIYDEVCHLKAALDDIHETFKRRPQQLSFEYRHYDNIHRILKSCRTSLEALDQALPQLKDETTPIQKLRLSIDRSLRGERVKDIVHHITSYTRILQLSLATLSLGELWLNRQSQDMILTEVRRIHRDIRATDLFSCRTETRVGPPGEPSVPSILLPNFPPSDNEGPRCLNDELREWRESVDEVAAAVSLYTPDESRISVRSHTSSTSLPTFEDDTSDPELEELDDVTRRVLHLTLESNQDITRELYQFGIYSQAAIYQRRGIKICRRLSDETVGKSGQDNGTGYTTKLYDMKEMLADILFDWEDARTDEEVEEILTQLLRETDESDRKSRLYHKLGRLYARQGKFHKSRKFLWDAFRGRSTANPRQKDLVMESAEMLIKTLQPLQLFDEARGVQSWLEEVFPANPESTDQLSPRLSPRVIEGDVHDVSSPYMWSQTQGFAVHSSHFGFDVCDPKMGKAPIHLAIEHQNFEVLQSMLQNIAHVEQRNLENAAPIHLAAATRNKQVCALLIEKGANVDVLDKNKRSPLHRCQCSSGGYEVAELILDRCPELIDRLDCYGKTALYMACELGNYRMASLLLSRGADPNRRGPLGLIPLIRAIDLGTQPTATIRIVQSMLEHGADAKLYDGSGRTAFEAAKDHLAAGEIRKLLSDSLSRRASATSTATTVDSTRSDRSSWLGVAYSSMSRRRSHG